MAAPSTNETIKIQSSIFDLDTFKSVTLEKETPFQPLSSTDEALSLASADEKKFLRIVNAGLRAETRAAAKADPTGFFLVDDEGNKTAFSGTAADEEKVNALVLTMAKTIFGFSKEMTPEQKQEAKESARNLIRSNTQMLEGLKKSAALSNGNSGE